MRREGSNDSLESFAVLAKASKEDNNERDAENQVTNRHHKRSQAGVGGGGSKQRDYQAFPRLYNSSIQVLP
jgi:hypothetical protein